MANQAEPGWGFCSKQCRVPSAAGGHGSEGEAGAAPTAADPGGLLRFCPGYPITHKHRHTDRASLHWDNLPRKVGESLALEVFQRRPDVTLGDAG